MNNISAGTYYVGVGGKCTSSRNYELTLTCDESPNIDLAKSVQEKISYLDPDTLGDHDEGNIYYGQDKKI